MNLKMSKQIFLFISLCFIIWASLFIYQSSFICIDGERHFSLFDDAMISMRYAWNLSHGNGLVWNAGEYIEGYTNLLMVLLMAISTFFFSKYSAVLFIQITGIIILIIIAFLALAIAKRIMPEIPDNNYRSIFLYLTFIAALSYYPLIFWSLMGMETGLLTVFILSSLLFTLKYFEEKNGNNLILVGLFSGLAYLTRPDSLVLSVIIFIYILFVSKKKIVSFSVFHLLMILLFSAFIGGQIIFRLQYYNEFFPNTYILKVVGIPFLVRIKNGFSFIMPFLSSLKLVLAIVALDFLFNYRKEKLLIISLFTGTLFYQVYVGGDPWLYWRIFSPVMPLILILFIHGVVEISESIFKMDFCKIYLKKNPIVSETKLPFLVIAIIVASCFLSINSKFLPEIFLLKAPFTSDENKKNVNTALAISEVMTDEGKIGVFWAGSIPYYTGRYAVDFWGKSDKHIANLPPDLSGKSGWNGLTTVPGHNKYDLKYSIKKYKPDYVQFLTWGTQDLSYLIQKQFIIKYYKGIKLIVRKNSPYILWEKINHSQ